MIVAQNLKFGPDMGLNVPTPFIHTILVVFIYMYTCMRYILYFGLGIREIYTLKHTVSFNRTSIYIENCLLTL